MNEKLRKKVKQLKVFQGIKYKEISDYMEMRKDSFYNWLNGQYDFGIEKQNRLAEIITNLSED